MPANCRLCGSRRFGLRHGGGLIIAVILGPVLWLLGLAVAAYVVGERDAIGIGLLVAAASLLVALIVLALLRTARRRRERRYVDGR